jgi:hypothetical protein
MSLFVDGNISTIEDLRTYDSSVLTVSSVEQVDLTAKLGLAQRELQVELQQMLARSSYGQMRGLNSFGQVTPTTIDLSGVVVTEPLRQWHCLRTLALVYRDAYYSQLNDRYQGRWQEYVKLDAQAQLILFNTGMGLVADPISQATAPTMTISAGSNTPATYYVRVSWLNASWQEGQGSATSAVIADQFHTLTVAATNAPANAAWWNVYAGLSEPSMTRQNAAPLNPGDSWILPAAGLVDGQAPSEGQSAEYYLSPCNTIPRG